MMLRPCDVARDHQRIEESGGSLVIVGLNAILKRFNKTPRDFLSGDSPRILGKFSKFR